MTADQRRKPEIFSLTGAAPAPTPAEAPPVPAYEDAPPEAQMALAVARAQGGGGWFGRLAWWAFGLLFTLWISVAAWSFIDGLIASNLWLGRAALALAAVVGAAALLGVFRELASLSRMGRVEELRLDADRAWRNADRPAAERALAALDRLYAGRNELAEARRRIKDRKGDSPDADGLLTLAERALMTPLDAAALASVRSGARASAVSTATIPVALLDALATLYINLRMIRQVAHIYNGRGGVLGSMRLARRVAAHVVAAGAVAIGDDLLGPLVGGGALSKLSRRFGEGLVNGALTARIGVMAMELSRPLPFEALDRPSVREVAMGALRGLDAGGA